ncbi:MAG: class I SAM-dependent methyltransferase [Bacteroidetes bacterium]|nr:class I SAM-dependent methyltransferase [Bacteroidota bacterium]
MSDINKEFSPSLIYPTYFIRHGLKQAIYKFSSQMTGRLLDFGCGSKPYKSFFKVDEYVGVDFQNEGHPHDNEQIDFFYDGKALPFPNEYFDCVLCSEVFEHIFNLEEVLKEINRVLKKDGKILITCPFVWNEHEIPFDYARYTLFALKDILERNNFCIVEFEKSGNFVTTLTQLWVLYFSILLQDRWRKIIILRWFYKITFVLFPNVIGLFLNIILPNNKTLYLNNIVLAKKK